MQKCTIPDDCVSVSIDSVAFYSSDCFYLSILSLLSDINIDVGEFADAHKKATEAYAGNRSLLFTSFCHVLSGSFRNTGECRVCEPGAGMDVNMEICTFIGDG